MPTLRLGEAERGEIASTFRKVAKRATNSIVFPLEEKEIFEFGVSLIDEEIRDAYRSILDKEPAYLSISRWHPEFVIHGEDCRYKVSMFQGKLPMDNMQLWPDGPRYDELFAWAQQMEQASIATMSSIATLEEVSMACTTFGQIQKVLGDEILGFLPEYMVKTLATAERASRYPSNLAPVPPEVLRRIKDTLALGSLSPEEQVGVTANSTKYSK